MYQCCLQETLKGAGRAPWGVIGQEERPGWLMLIFMGGVSKYVRMYMHAPLRVVVGGKEKDGIFAKAKQKRSNYLDAGVVRGNGDAAE